jgi:CheY-like chemotaxis protein
VKATATGHETILLVEDEKAILTMTTMMLDRLGYKTIGASSPAEAVRIGESCSEEIDLLLTDVVMPGNSNRRVSID